MSKKINRNRKGTEIMEKEFIPYEHALALKELGFDEPCLNRFYTKPQSKMFGVDEKSRHYPIKNTSKKLYTMGEHFVLNDSNVILAPLYQQAFRWFREKCSIQATIEPTKDQYRFELGFNYWIWNTKTAEEWFTEPRDRPAGDYVFDTYEEAELACLEKLIEIVKEQK